MVVVEKPTLASPIQRFLSICKSCLLMENHLNADLYRARFQRQANPRYDLKTQAKGLQDFALSEWKDNGTEPIPK